jgi:hypothetical protein
MGGLRFKGREGKPGRHGSPGRTAKQQTDVREPRAGHRPGNIGSGGRKMVVAFFLELSDKIKIIQILTGLPPPSALQSRSISHSGISWEDFGPWLNAPAPLRIRSGAA